MRVAALQRRVAAGITAQQGGLHTQGATRPRLDLRPGLVARQTTLCAKTLLRAAEAGIRIVGWEDLEPTEVALMRTLFTERIHPVLTPLAVDPAHPFPYISGLSLNLAVVVRDDSTEEEHFARIKVPPLLPRFVATDELDSASSRSRR